MPHYFDFPITEYLLTIICFYIVNHPLPCKKYFGAKDWAKKWKRGGAVLRGLKARQRKATKEQPWEGLQNYYREAIQGRNSRCLTSLNMWLGLSALWACLGRSLQTTRCGMGNVATPPWHGKHGHSSFLWCACRMRRKQSPLPRGIWRHYALVLVATARNTDTNTPYVWAYG